MSKVNTDFESVQNDRIVESLSHPQISIHVKCSDLPKLDVGSQSDPMAVLFVKNNNKWVEQSRTEVIWNNPNPEFVKQFTLPFVFESMQPVRVVVYDCDSENAPLQNHDLVGYVEFDLQMLGSNLGQAVTMDLKNEKRKVNGRITFLPEQAALSGKSIRLSIQASKMKKMRTFSKNCPFLLISKCTEANHWVPVYRSEVIMKAYSCRWKEFSIPLAVLCNGDMQCPIRIYLMDNREKKADEEIGYYETTVDSLQKMGSSAVCKAMNTKNKPVGDIFILGCTIEAKPTFLDYLRSGIQLNLVTAIDFTASNRTPTDPRSLHFIGDGKSLNQYEACIYDVGGVICPYDTDQAFAVYGFGGKVGANVEHCFPLTFDPMQPCVAGLQGIIDAYHDSLTKVQLSGPTLFHHVIKAADELASASFQSSHTYTILMILTDGVINDQRETIEAIVHASESPLSIIIVGVGNADFSAMDALDADKTPLRSSTGKVMSRDIVQFVPYRDFKDDTTGRLAAAVLQEIPAQVDQYCRKVGFVPQIIQ